LQLYFQAISQLRKCFPNGQDQTVLATTSQVFFAVNDLQTAQYVSDRCGEETILVPSGGTNDGYSYTLPDGFAPGSRTLSYGSNDGWQQQPRRLLTPQEVAGLDPRVAVSFVAGVGVPVVTRLAMAYEEPSLGLRPGFGRRTLAAFKTLVASVALLSATALIAGLLVTEARRAGAPAVRSVQPAPKAHEFRLFPEPEKGR
jgi:type IV secretion system protein VirD4